MQQLFIPLIKLSLISSLFALAVMLVRLIFLNAPKWLFCLLWGAVALRLICPFTLESPLSLVPDPLASGQLIDSVGSSFVGPVDVLYESNAGYSQAVEAGQKPVYSSQGFYVVTQKDSLEPAKTVEETVFPLLSGIWLAGVLLMLTYLTASFLALRRKMAEATRLRENIWQCEQVDSPFVLGFFKPRIYLPYSLTGENTAHVIAHEQAHIRRKDHWWKPLGFVLLSFHWFNPILWLAYILLCRDIEAACDEKVIRHMEKEEIRAYSTALLNCSIHRRRITACPLAFGEVGVKERIKHIMNYKKPTFWIILGVALVCIAVVICFATSPATETDPAPSLQTTPSQPETAATTPNDNPLLDLVDKIANNPDCAYSSNPYDYIKAKQAEYDQILSYGHQAVDCFVAQLRRGENGLKGYIMAAACSEITRIGEKDGDYNTDWWATAQQWLALYDAAGADPRSTLTLDDVLALSGKGKELTWEDLADFACTDIGSGLYVMRFDIAYGAEPEFYLLVGGAKRTGKPMYALLCTYGSDRTVDIREGSVKAFLETHSQDALENAISQAIASHYHAHEPDGLIHTQSFVLLHSETASATPYAGNDYHRQVLRVYLLVMAQQYTVSASQLIGINEGELIPTRLTFTVDPGDLYTLQEYWTPRANTFGTGYIPDDVREYFPEGIAEEALAVGKYDQQLRQICNAKANAYASNVLFHKDASLVKKYPEYFNLNTQDGLTVCVYQMAAQSYSFVLFAGNRTDYTWDELLHKPSTTLPEMQQIVRAYNLDRSKITILPVQMPHSSYLYTIDDAYRAEIERLFWGISQDISQPSYTGVIDSILFDVDNDGVQELCTLGYGRTSGLFSFVFHVAPFSNTDANTDGLECIVVLAGHYNLSFETQSGKLRIRGETTTQPHKTVWFDIAVRDGHIHLQCEEEGIFFPSST